MFHDFSHTHMSAHTNTHRYPCIYIINEEANKCKKKIVQESGILMYNQIPSTLELQREWRVQGYPVTQSKLETTLDPWDPKSKTKLHKKQHRKTWQSQSLSYGRTMSVSRGGANNWICMVANGQHCVSWSVCVLDFWVFVRLCACACRVGGVH